ncbi:MAG: acyl-CoA synthetase [Proteobacteria bacterium]|nr:acyl-CoA synthetase [Pseudomonadota bacterium]
MHGYQHRDQAGIAQFERTPIEDRLQFSNTYDLLGHGAGVDPDAPAISFISNGGRYGEPEVFSYRRLVERVTQTANLLHDLGMGRTDVVSYLLPNLPQSHFVLWGGEATGVVNPINPMLEPGTIAEICRAAGSKVVAGRGVDPAIWAKGKAVRAEVDSIETMIVVGAPGDEADGVVGYDRVIDRYRTDRLDSSRRIAPDDRASLFHTGGTTGTPKLAPHTHLNEVANAFMAGALLDVNPGEAMLSGLPLFHVNAATITGSVPFSFGGHVVILGPMGYRDPGIMRNFFKIVEHYRAVTFSAVPTVLSMLLDVPVGGADVSSLRFAICGAAPLSVELFQRFEAHSGLKLMEGYGLTEGTCVSSGNPLFGERKIGSIGLRIPYQRMKVFRPGLDQEADIDEIGVVAIKGPNVFSGYVDPAHNRDIWPADGWFNTGDMGRRDPDGYFWLTGRQKELIIRGGHNIDPAGIEEPLYQLDGVQVAAAVGRPDAYAGEVPVAYVQLQEGADLTAEAILEHLQQNIGERAAVPKEVIIVDAVPLTPVGKIFKPKLRWDAVRRTYQAELAALGDLVEAVRVEVVEDKLHGTLARVTLEPAAGASPDEIRARVRDILGRFTIKYDLAIE